MAFLNFIRKSKSSGGDDYKFGIALSGGGARGFAHIGVLKALLEHNMEPDIISGTSMGSLIGLLYAAGKSPDDILGIIKKVSIIKLFKVAWRQHGMFEMKGVRKILEEEIGVDDFSTLKKPLYVSISNISTGALEVKSSGALFDYVLASCSVPVFFAPMVIGDTTYIDGGLFDNLPSRSIREKCRYLLGVNVNYINPENHFDGVRDIGQRSFSLAIDQNVRSSKTLCDYVIEFPEIKDYSLWNFDKLDEIVDIGYNSTISLLAENKIIPYTLQDNKGISLFKKRG